MNDPFKRETFYEWDFEEVDEHGDILDHDHHDKLGRIGPDFDRDKYQLVLVRDSGCDADGLDDRQWAYTQLGNDGLWFLPSHFDGGNVVPKKYHAEIARWQVNL